MMAGVIILLLIVLLIPFFYKNVFSMNKRLIGIYIFHIFVREVVAVINVYFFTMPGSKGDAISFHKAATNIANTGEYVFILGHQVYELFLGFVYLALGSSSMLGHQLSILIFSLSCVFLLKTVNILGVERYKSQILLVYGALPSIILNGTFILRESYEVLFMMMAVYLGIKSIKSNRNVLLNLGFIISLILLGALHRALLIYSFFLLFAFIWWSNNQSSKLKNYKKKSYSILYIIAIILIIPLLGNLFQDMVRIFYDLNVFEVVSAHRKVTSVSTASCGVELDNSSIISFMLSISEIYFHYLFAPFLWNVSNFYDIYAFFESTVRMILIYFSVKIWHKAQGEKRTYLALMLLIFISISFLWAVGTTNYGTAIRHRMMDWWIISILGTPYLVEYLRCKFKKISR